MQKIVEMCDLKRQAAKIRSEIDAAIADTIESSAFIKGAKVAEFEKNAAEYIGTKHCVSVGNGTDALYVAIMMLNLAPGSEVITPSFTFVATAEAILRAGLKPVFVDVSESTFNIDAKTFEAAITPNTKAAIIVHLFGQSAEMESIMKVANKHSVTIIEDFCQSFGAECEMAGKPKKVGAIGKIGCTSFFPSKNLGCFGDGGAIFTDDDTIADNARAFANHGMRVKYTYDSVGINSRLDAMQAGILNVKIKHVDSYLDCRRKAAAKYKEKLADVDEIIIPTEQNGCRHTYNQFTIRVKDGRRDELKAYLEENGIPSMIYYPYPIHQQKAYLESPHRVAGSLTNTENLCKEVLSLPMHTELEDGIIETIASTIKDFFKK